MIAALWLLAALAHGAPCALEAPADAPFAVRPPEGADHVRMLLELWVQPDQGAWLDAMLAALEARQERATVVLPLPEPETEPALIALAERAARGGHEVALRFRDDQVILDAQAPPGPMRRRLKPLRQAAGSIKTAVAPLPTRAAEAMLGRLGFRTLLQARGPATAIPRPAVVFEGQPRIGAVLHAGPYAGPCGVRPFADPFTPASADRAVQALWGAARIEGVPVLRVAIHGTAEVGPAPAILGRWLDEVLGPAGIHPATPDRTRQEVLAYFRTGRIMAVDPLDAGGGRLVSLDEVRAAAEALDRENILPRTLPGELNLTEAFLAFTLVLADQVEGEVVRLAALRGPEAHARSSIEGIVPLDREAVVRIAKALAADLPASVPVSMPVDGHTLNAAELLTAFAAAIRGRPEVWPTASPEPHAAGQGWGEATLP